MARRAYQTDLSDAEWYYIGPHLPPGKLPDAPGSTVSARSSTPSSTCSRAAALGGLLPHDFPPWKTVYHYFRAWRIDGTWERLHEILRRKAHVRLERDPQPSAGIVDSQSVKTTGVGGEERGYDPAKKVKAVSVTCWWTHKDW